MLSSPLNHHRVVIAGGGIAGLEALIALRLQAPELTRVTLVAPSDRFAYRALGVEAPFGRGAGRRYALSTIAADLRATYLRDGLAAVDAAAHQVTLSSGATLGYDTLVIALGARTYPAFGHGITFDRESEPETFDELLADIDARLVPRVAVVVPEHVGWTLPAYELALSTRQYGLSPRGRDIDMTLVTHEPQPLAAFGTTASRAVAAVLADAGVEVLCDREALVMSDGALIAGSRWITADRIVALPRLAGPRPTGVPADLHGFVTVDRHGRVAGLEDVYAAGDGTNGPIKQGGLAAQQAGAVADHVMWRLRGGAEPEPPAPVLRGILTTPRGPLHLQADLGPGPAGEGSIASWEPLWPAPGRVASRWLASYLGGAPAVTGAVTV
jgi:sulfide:quinone oxidoreductase